MTEQEQLIYDLVVDLYPQVYISLTGSKKYKLRLTEARIRQIERFSRFVSGKVKSCNEETVKSFLQYAFGKYAGRENIWGGKNAFPLNWIVSKTLFKEFLDSSKGKKYVMGEKLRKEKTKLGNDEQILIKSKIKKKIENKNKEKMLVCLNQLEELEKQRYYNSDKGFYWCVDFTTLANPMSWLCSNCKNFDNCKKMLESNFKGVYDLRFKIK